MTHGNTMPRRPGLSPLLVMAIVSAATVASCGGEGGARDGGAGPDAALETCRPACRDGFLCLEGRCIEACNPPCASGERCTGDGRCVPQADASTRPDGSTPDAAPLDGGALADASSDASSDGGIGDAGSSARCPAGQVLCDDGCRAPTLPAAGSAFEVWSTSGRTSDYDEQSGLDVDPCSGTFGLVASEEVSGPTANREVHFHAVPLDGSANRVRVSFGPGDAGNPRVVFARDRFVLVWSDPRHDATPDTCEPACHREVYFAAYGIDGSEVVAERRLTTVTEATQRISDVELAYHPEADRLLIVWRRLGEGTPDTLQALVTDRTGRPLVDPMVVATGDERRAPEYPILRVEDDHWVIFYMRNNRAGTFIDRPALRSVAPDGTLGTFVPLDEPRPQEKSFAVARRSDGAWSTLMLETLDRTGTYLRRWTADWSSSSQVVTPALFHERGNLGYDGSDYYVVERRTPNIVLARLNAEGTETASVRLDTTETTPIARWIRVYGDTVLTTWMERTRNARTGTWRHVVRAQPIAPEEF